MTTANFAKPHTWDGWFWVPVLSLAVVLVAAAFDSPVRSRLAGAAPPESRSLIIHAWSFAGLLVLLGVQAALVARRRLRCYRECDDAPWRR